MDYASHADKPLPNNYLIFLKGEVTVKNSWVVVALLSLLVSCSGEKKESQEEAATVTADTSVASLLAKEDPAVAQRDTRLTDEEKRMFGQTVLVPSPAELFSALDKLATVDWQHVVSYNPERNYPDEYSRALNLGLRVADGFIAVYAQDSNKLGEMAEAIYFLAHALNVQESLLGKREALLEHARKDEWMQLRQALDGVQADVLKEIERMGESDIATLAVVAGWLEGIRIVSTVLATSYNEEASMVLYQPQLAEYFSAQFGKLSEQAKANPVVEQIGKQLSTIQQLCNVGEGKPLPQSSVAQLQSISSALVKAIEKKEGSKA